MGHFTQEEDTFEGGGVEGGGVDGGGVDGRVVDGRMVEWWMVEWWRVEWWREGALFFIMDKMSFMDFELLAAQLRKPEGEFGKTVAENMNSSNRAINLHTIQLLQLKAYDKVLEVGMGNGFFCKDVLARHDSIHYTGCDFSDLMITEAEALNENYIVEKRAQFVVGDVHALPFEANSFGKLFTINTIYFWEEPQQALSEIYRVLEPGGAAIISLRTKESMLQLPFVSYGFRLWEEDELLPLLGDAGFASIRIVHEPDPIFHMADKEIQLHSLYIICRK